MKCQQTFDTSTKFTISEFSKSASSLTTLSVIWFAFAPLGTHSPAATQNRLPPVPISTRFPKRSFQQNAVLLTYSRFATIWLFVSCVSMELSATIKLGSTNDWSCSSSATTECRCPNGIESTWAPFWRSLSYNLTSVANGFRLPLASQVPNRVYVIIAVDSSRALQPFLT